MISSKSSCMLMTVLWFCGCTQLCSACLTSGICGTGCGMPLPLPLPPPPVCMGGCGQGYGCGQYGCYSRARARSSKTLTAAVRPSDRETLLAEISEVKSEPILTPDEKFRECCLDRHLPDACVQKCTFNTYTKQSLQAMYLHMDACPLQAASDIHFCAAQGRDHRECCTRNSVTSTLAGNRCLVFCDQRPGNMTKLDMSYLSCYERFENIKGCFWHDITENHASEPVQRFDML